MYDLGGQTLGPRTESAMVWRSPSGIWETTLNEENHRISDGLCAFRMGGGMKWGGGRDRDAFGGECVRTNNVWSYVLNDIIDIGRQLPFVWQL